ncbi:MAG: hypothetical protein IJB86_02345 [Clostridia bacterium]|nr:hypothetical protein [Clostridia bacterium]
MAATCPKCGGKLKITDWKPDCPHCGVNMVYYGMEERLLLDADKAEAEHARMQPRVDRLKASFIGSKLAIARIVFSFIPILGVLLPLAKFSFNAPFAAADVANVNAISIYTLISEHLDFDALLSMLGSEVFGTTFIFFAASLVCLLLSVVGILAHLILLTLACSPKGKARNMTLGIINILLPVISCVLFYLFSQNIMALFPSVVTASSIGWGIFVYIGLLVVSLVVDMLTFKQGIDVKYKPCFVGNIPAEEYFKLVDDGVPLEKIRAVMAERTAEKEAEEAAAEAEKETVNA